MNDAEYPAMRTGPALSDACQHLLLRLLSVQLHAHLQQLLVVLGAGAPPVERNAVLRRPAPGEGRALPSREEIARVIAAADAALRPVLLLAALTGLRVGELRVLTWGDVRGRWLHVPAIKIVQPPVLLSSGALLLLEQLRHAAPGAPGAPGEGEALVFHDGTGRAWAYAVLFRGWAAAAARAGLPHLRIYDLRRRALRDADPVKAPTGAVPGATRASDRQGDGVLLGQAERDLLLLLLAVLVCRLTPPTG